MHAAKCSACAACSLGGRATEGMRHGWVGRARSRQLSCSFLGEHGSCTGEGLGATRESKLGALAAKWAALPPGLALQRSAGALFSSFWKLFMWLALQKAQGYACSFASCAASCMPSKKKKGAKKRRKPPQQQGAAAKAGELLRLPPGRCEWRAGGAQCCGRFR